MENHVKIKAELVTKEFDLLKKKSDKIKNLFNFGKKDIETFWALKGVSFEVYAGESIGLIGINGSGKSTLSNIISGIIPQTSGKLDINGDTTIIAIGAGLKNQLTGLENIQLKCIMNGMTNKEINDSKQAIIDFADLGEFIYQPVKSYSSGMKSRLGFAIAVNQNPDIMIIDEALAVGDDTFYQKCVDKIFEFKELGKTIIFVSHSLSQVSKLCDRTIWMHYGDIKEIGDTKEVISKYKEFSTYFKKMSKEEKKEYQEINKQAQVDFNLEQLVEKVPEKNSRKEVREVKDITKKITYGNKFSIWTKSLLILLIITCVISATLSFKPNFFLSLIESRENFFLLLSKLKELYN